MVDLINTFDSDEQLANIQVDITGQQTATLTETDFSESGSGPYTYEATYTTTTDGDYTFTLNLAEDAAGNDGSSGENATITVGDGGGSGSETLADDFEDNITDWQNQDDYQHNTTVASAGSGSMEYLATKNTDFGNSLYTFSSPGQYTDVRASLRVEGYGGEPEFSVGEYNADTTGDDGPRVGIGDGTSAPSGNVWVFDGTDRVDTGISWPSTGTFYRLNFDNIDWSNNTFDLVIEDTSGTVQASSTGEPFPSAQATQVEHYKTNGQDAAFYVDELYYTP